MLENDEDFDINERIWDFNLIVGLFLQYNKKINIIKDGNKQAYSMHSTINQPGSCLPRFLQ
jgi:hypothetical protein